MTHRREFPQSVREQLGYYVYLLADPADDKVFYVGKGTGDRLFAHLRGDVSESSAKLARIRAIQARDREVVCQIARHGLTEKEAFEVESTVIDVLGLDQLANEVSGIDARVRGLMTVDETIAIYEAPPANITEPVVLINIRKQYKRAMSEAALYDATRNSWKMAPDRHSIQYAVAVSGGIVRQVYSVSRWYNPADAPDRWAFEGSVAPDLAHYIGCSVAHYSAPGAQNPIKYLNC
jgi:uncharacterized protein